MRTLPRRLLLMASILMDVSVHVDRWPDRGDDRLARRGQVAPGGAFNLLMAARRLAFPVAYGGLVGSGPFGQEIQAAMREHEVPLLTEPLAEDTGFDVAVVEGDGERTFITAPGAEAMVTADRLAAVTVEPTDAVYVSGYDLAYPSGGGVLADWVGAISPDPLVVLDPGPLVAEIPADRLTAVLSRTDILTLNRREAGLLVGHVELDRQLDLLRARLAPGARLALRDGAEGVYTQESGETVHVPSRRVKPADTTGAGDVHTATLVVRLASGASWLEALLGANLAAAWSVQREGSSASPTLEELEIARKEL